MDLQDLLSLETKELLEFKFSNENLLIWPFVRYQILSGISQKLNNYSAPHASNEKLKIIEIILYIITTIKSNPFKAQNFSIAIFATTLDNTFKLDGRYFNRVHDYFALEYENSTLIIEESGRRKYRLPRYSKNWASGDLVNIIASIRSRVNILNKLSIVDIDKFMQYIENKFADYFSYTEFNKIRKNLIYTKKIIKYYREYYKILLKKIKPKIIFINCASYGGMKSMLIKLAKEMNIKVAEFQHGIIYRDHPAYNYSRAIFDSAEYAKYLPDFLLTYGEYWNQNMTHPSPKITIGNPHYNSMLDKYRQRKENILKNDVLTILIVSQGIVTEKFVHIAKVLSESLDTNKYNIIFRLHPGEVPFENRYRELYNKPELTISKTGDIYELIFKSDFIIAYNSTTIFEALGFEKPIFILDDDVTKHVIPNDIGIRFKNASNLVEIIKRFNVAPNTSEKNYEYYWESNWKKNYHEFIDLIAEIENNAS